MTHVQIMAVGGVLLNLAGVLILFRYGMPYRVETKGEGAWLLEATDYGAIRAERTYRRLGLLGLCLVIAGSALQIAAVLLA
jgi:hypothetical protein